LGWWPLWTSLGRAARSLVLLGGLVAACAATAASLLLAQVRRCAA
jgi:hypothetical protein